MEEHVQWIPADCLFRADLEWNPENKVAWKGTYCALLQNKGYCTHTLWGKLSIYSHKFYVLHWSWSDCQGGQDEWEETGQVYKMFTMIKLLASTQHLFCSILLVYIKHYMFWLHRVIIRCYRFLLQLSNCNVHIYIL
jgi:hypothetical protein